MQSYLSPDQTLDIFREAGALLEGHFILSSGLHSPMFFQKTWVFQHPHLTEKVCKGLAHAAQERFGTIDVVVAPAVGAIIPGYETARWLNARAVFVERENGQFQLRRGFEIKPEDRVLMVEDVVTTGLSSRECLAAIAGQGQLVGAACIVDRSNGKADLGVPLISLVKMDVPAYRADDLPPELAAIPATKPGSRHLSI